MSHGSTLHKRPGAAWDCAAGWLSTMGSTVTEKLTMYSDAASRARGSGGSGEESGYTWLQNTHTHTHTHAHTHTHWNNEASCLPKSLKDTWLANEGEQGLGKNQTFSSVISWVIPHSPHFSQSGQSNHYPTHPRIFLITSWTTADGSMQADMVRDLGFAWLHSSACSLEHWASLEMRHRYKALGVQARSAARTNAEAKPQTSLDHWSEHHSFPLQNRVVLQRTNIHSVDIATCERDVRLMCICIQKVFLGHGSHSNPHFHGRLDWQD